MIAAIESILLTLVAHGYSRKEAMYMINTPEKLAAMIRAYGSAA
jgi:hypothetical protein